MKQWKYRWALLPLLVLLSACGAVDEPSPQESPEPASLFEPAQEEAPEEQEPTPPTGSEREGGDAEPPAPESEPESSAPIPDQPPSQAVEAPVPDNHIAIQIVDRDGNPVQNVSGNVNYSASHPQAGIHLTRPDNPEQDWSGADGRLYLNMVDWEQYAVAGQRECVVHLHTRYDEQNARQIKVVMPESATATLRVVWEGDPPPAERPAQTAGLRIRIVDAAGNPVEGVELSGSPYTREVIEEMLAGGGANTAPGLRFGVGASDRDGVIRWDNPKYVGTYELTAKWEFDGEPWQYDGPSEEYEIAYTGEGLQEVTLVWDH